MKKIFAAPFAAAAAAALLTFASPASAGILTLDDGSPTFNPQGTFSNNTIVANTIIVGGLIDLEGNVTITPSASDTATIEVSGTYSAEAGEIFSVAYKFAGDNNTGGPINYTLNGSVSGVPIPPITGTIEPGLHVYQGTAEQPTPFPFPVNGNFSGDLTLTFGPAPLAPASVPSIAIPGTLDLTVQQIDFKLDVIPASILPPAQSQNISTRANVGTGDNVLIGGIIITGTDTKQVVLRAIGPSLSISNVPDVLADPVLELHLPDGSIVTNNDWKDNAVLDQTALIASGLAPTNDLEAAIIINPPPQDPMVPMSGLYTAIVRGNNATEGIGLMEVYDLDDPLTTTSELGNISTRGFVSTGDSVLIGGFITGPGTDDGKILVRAIGPSLMDADVPGPLMDPTVEVFNGNGDSIGFERLAGWRRNPGRRPGTERERGIGHALRASRG